MTILAAKVEEAEGKTKTLEQQMESLEEDALKAAGAIKKVELELADTLAKVISHEAENEALRRQAEFLEDQISTLQVTL
jgi:chromosome segregation ATPase